MTSRRLFWFVLFIALAVRLIYALDRPVTQLKNTGGDSNWYWKNAYVLMSGSTTAEIDSVRYDVSKLPTPPLYLMFIGLPQHLWSETTGYYLVLIAQAFLGLTTAYYAALLTKRITGSDRSALITAFLIGCSPAFVLESGQIFTETLFIVLMTVGLYLFVLALDNETHRVRTLVISAVFLGLATLTRAVLLLFPLMLAVIWIIHHRRRDRWRSLFLAMIFTVTYLSIVLTWTAYNWVRWNRVVIAGEGFAAFLYIGATGWDSPQSVDQRLLSEGAQQSEDQVFTQDAYTTAASAAIFGNLTEYLSRRIRELTGALLQPHGTVYFPGESLRDLVVQWLTKDRSFQGLLEVFRGDQFVAKLLLYLFHYGTIILGLIGAWKIRSRGRLVVPLVGLIVYLLGIHFFLFALPRYLFPALIAWAILAGGVLFDATSEKSNFNPPTDDPVLAQ